MLTLHIIMDGESAWPELKDRKHSIVHVADGPPMQVAILQGGMKSGRPSVTIRVDLPDGRTVLAETSARLFCTAARAFMAKYPELFEGD